MKNPGVVEESVQQAALNAGQASEVALAQPQPGPENGRYAPYPTRVLIVDDEPGVLRLCQRLLQRAGYYVLAASLPEEGVQILQAQHFDLLLVDIRMPGMDGFRLLEIARQMQPDLAVVMMTGFGTIETAIEALYLGADGLALKPFTAEELERSIQRALQSNQRKQDALRLQTLRPLFDVAEILFAETDPAALERLIVETSARLLHAQWVGLYEKNGGAEPAAGGAANPALAFSAMSQHPTAGKPAQPAAGQHVWRLYRGSGRRQASGIPPLDPASPTDRPPRRLSDAEEHGPAGPANPEYNVAFMARGGRLAGVPLQAVRRGSRPASGSAPASGRFAAAGGALWLMANRGQPPPADPPASPEYAGPGAPPASTVSPGAAPFSPADLELLAILARLAGAALNNAHLHADLRASLWQVETSQRALIQSEKVAVAGRLTASIAHEVNNPLQAMRNCLHLAMRKDLPAAQRKSYLDMSASELERLMRTVQRMLDLYRPTALDRRPTQINDLIYKVVDLLGRQLRDHHISLTLHLGARLPLALVTPDQIQQVLLNLAINAIEMMPNGGRLAIASQTRSYPPGAGTATVEVFIADSGPGVPARNRQIIFEPFFTTKDGGTGLGLAVSYGIIAAHGGSLELLSPEESELAAAGAAGTAPVFGPGADIRPVEGAPAATHPDASSWPLTGAWFRLALSAEESSEPPLVGSGR